MKNILLYLVFIGLAGPAIGQTTLQVLTKTIDKTVKWKSGYSLEVIGEKTEVEVSPGASNEIQVHAELSTKHPDLNTARADLDNWKFVVSTVGKKVYVRAYIGLKTGQTTPESNFRAKIVVQVPAECPVSMDNKLGKVRLENLRGPIALNGEFCNFMLTNLGGDVWLNSKYGTVEGSGFSGKIALKTNRADVTLSDLRADCSVQCEYGAISVEARSTTGNLAVKGEKSEIRLLLASDARHNVNLKSEYGSLSAPQKFNAFNPATNVQQANLQSGEGRPFVSIETTFGKIIVE